MLKTFASSASHGGSLVPFPPRQVMRSSAYSEKGLLSVLNIQTVDAVCLTCEADGMRELDAWANASYTHGQHPIRMYTLERRERLTAAWYPNKEVCDVNFVGNFKIHCSLPLEGVKHRIQDSAEVMLMHMRNLYRVRPPELKAKPLGPLPGDADMWWPLQPQLRKGL
ncbi:MAG: hypothetical protein WDW36_008983 [Sanguina aurantia]